ncbi:MAG TPA: DUF1634 domain-containing protein [Flavisolibacter sp.]|nr:DUF1634 domain-containing protein [Flavisolibacter sp.]
MKQTKQTIQDRDLELLMGNLLRYGVLASLVVVLIGAVFYLLQHGGEQPSYRQFVGEPKRLTEIKQVWQTALQGRGRSIIQLGLFILMATPVARIVFSVIGYILERDWLYIVITLLVLGVILYSV